MGIGNFISDEKLIEGLKAKNAEVLDFIYKNYYPVIENTVIERYNGSRDDAKDFFQDAMLSVYSSLTADPPLVIRHKLITYLATICRRKMIDKIRTTRTTTLLEVEKEPDIEMDVIKMITRNDRKRLIEKYFGELGEKCRTIFMMFIHGYSASEVALKLNLANSQVTKNQRLKCKKKLFEKIYNDPLLKELRDGKPWNLRKLPEW